MFTSRVEVLISRQLDEVFAFVSDVRNRTRWDDSVDSEELTSPEPIQVGTTVRTRLRLMVKGVKIRIHSDCSSVVLVQETAEVVAALDGTAGG
jgi:hypothetical protein